MLVIENTETRRQRDHEKRAYALTKGFVVYDITNKMVTEDPELIIHQLKEIISHRRTYDDVVKKVGASYCKIFSKEQNFDIYEH